MDDKRGQQNKVVGVESISAEVIEIGINKTQTKERKKEEKQEKLPMRNMT